ncbi:MAG TPA: DegT/DnrJ/EryC1/StrS family aminotransferase [Verrucomicrobiota bacterium]|nr:DegT/DnrJ/EryC1/StrS family aminotransferase [Verrucomicrobiota bacterium]HNU51967.1 DegT/DnrJ/EryC1/StrS family aminotransferase [Verrucomicrobiota bacterium]
MSQHLLNRRQFLAAASAGSAAAAAAQTSTAGANPARKTGRLALLGGDPIRKNRPWPRWPHCDEEVVNAITKTTRSGIWCRIQSASGTVPTFEKAYASLIGAKFCVATGSGTQALHTAVEAFGIGAGDEVITSPYTDPGTIAAILASRALPVLADLDPESFQLDPADVERRITPATRAIMPVHMMGQPCHLERFLALGKERNLVVIEDACQAHLAEYQGRKLGTLGTVGCYSFQTSKTIACGEGGAVVGDDEALMDRCYTVHNHGTSRRGLTEVIGPKYRMNEFEAAVLLGQLAGVQARHERRNANARHLSERLRGFPGLVPQKLYPGTQSGSFYLYAMSYHKEHFNQIPRSRFLKALDAEGVSLSPYIERGLHREPWIDFVCNNRVYQKMFPERRLQQFREEMVCPRCDQVCQDMVMLWASGPLLGTTADMDDVADAILKVYENRDQLAAAQ